MFENEYTYPEYNEVVYKNGVIGFLKNKHNEIFFNIKTVLRMLDFSDVAKNMCSILNEVNPKQLFILIENTIDGDSDDNFSDIYVSYLGLLSLLKKHPTRETITLLRSLNNVLYDQAIDNAEIFNNICRENSEPEGVKKVVEKDEKRGW
jgi:hypothetical protein